MFHIDICGFDVFFQHSKFREFRTTFSGDRWGSAQILSNASSASFLLSRACFFASQAGEIWDLPLNNQILRPQTTRFWGETNRISLYKSLIEYGMCWFMHDFAVEVSLLCGSYPVITKGHLPQQNPGRPLPIYRRMAHPICISWRSAGGSGDTKKLEPCNVSGGSSSISHDFSFFGWHMLSVFCVDVRTVSHVILRGLVVCLPLVI